MNGKLRNSIIKFIGVSFVAILVIVGLFVAQFLVVNGYARYSAYALAPPEYPNSELIEKWQSGGPDTQWDRRTYQTPDNLDEVFSFMEEQMPGFSLENDSANSVVYQNHAKNTNWLAQLAAKQACTSLHCIEKSALIYPSASVRFYSDPDNSTGTLIEVRINWPSQ